MNNFKWLMVLVLVLLCSAFVFAQADSDDPVQLVGLSLSDLISRYGTPKQVYPVRGKETWQDDVVFVYDAGEFFVIGNRVWQLKLKSAYNVKEGDAKAAVERTLGNGRDFDGFTLYQLPGRPWPVMLRINWNTSSRVAGIFIYRSDL